MGENMELHKITPDLVYGRGWAETEPEFGRLPSHAEKILPEKVAVIRDAKDRTKAPETAPPHGLFLNKVFFDEEERAAFRLTGVPFFR